MPHGAASVRRSGDLARKAAGPSNVSVIHRVGTGVTLTSLRRRLGEHLLASGTEMAFDRQHIARGLASAGRRAALDDPVVARTLALVQAISRIKVKAGLLLLP